MFRLVITCPIIFLLNGCVSSMKKEVSQLEDQTTKIRESLSEAQSWLSRNSDVYSYGQCQVPPHGPRPEITCETQDEAKEQALVMCIIPWKSCELVLNMFTEELDSFSKKFMASEACNATVAKLMGEKYALDSMVMGAAEAMSSQSCEKGSLFGCMVSGVTELYKFQKFTECVSTETNKCYKNYQKWVNGPSERFETCNNMVNIEKEESSNLHQLEEDISKKKNSWSYRIFSN